MSTQKVNITSPVGRIVAGSLYKGNTTDFDGKPLVVKTGANAGQPRVQFFFALAIPKEAGHTHWAQTEWGKQIWSVGHAAFPQAAQRPDFAWKIDDGDSQIPNKRGKKPCENEGYPGHWILKLSGGFAPKVYRAEANGYVQITEADAVKPGHYVQVAFSVDGNGNQNNSGVYLNHGMVCFRAYGQEIVFGPDVNEAGFGAAPLPAGASMTPPASALPMPAAVTGTTTAAPIAPVPPSIPVTPNPQFLQVPGAAPALPTTSAPVTAVPAAPLPTAPASPSRTMTAKANGASYEAFIAANWTDAQLIQQGFMTM